MKGELDYHLLNFLLLCQSSIAHNSSVMCTVLRTTVCLSWKQYKMKSVQDLSVQFLSQLMVVCVQYGTEVS